MEWEWRGEFHEAGRAYPMPLDKGRDRPDRLDWGPLVEAMSADLQAGVELGLVSARFHASLIDGILAVGRRSGHQRVVLTGGCFANRLLLEGAVRRLTEEGFTPYWHQRVPPGDGGIALGQIVAAANEWEKLHVPGDSRQTHRSS